MVMKYERCESGTVQGYTLEHLKKRAELYLEKQFLYILVFAVNVANHQWPK